MAKDDHLDKEISVSTRLTDHGIEARARSRTLSAIDRLGGNIFELLNTKIERSTSRARAIIDGEKQLIEAMAKSAVERIDIDPMFADRALRAHFQDVLQNQDNKDGVVQMALEDLRQEPPSMTDANSGPEELSPEFQSRFAEYAKVASTEDLRARWGRVLATEIRKPGTFSPKVLRIVDELDADTAFLFERFCRDRIGRWVPIIVSGEMPIGSILTLETSGLIVNPGLTGHNLGGILINIDGIETRLYPLGEYGVSVPVEALGRANLPGEKPFNSQGGLPVYVLTSPGLAISTIIPERQIEILREIQDKLRVHFGPETPIRMWRRVPNDPQAWDAID